MRVRFPVSRIAMSLGVSAAFALLAACNNNDVTGANAALARLTVDAPDSATSGQNFDIHVTAQDIGVQSIQNGVVTVTLPSPLTVVSLNAQSGTASFSGSNVTWTLGSLDANSQSVLTITSVGTTATQMTSLSVEAQMTANGINAGDAVATDTVTLNP